MTNCGVINYKISPMYMCQLEKDHKGRHTYQNEELVIMWEANSYKVVPKLVEIPLASESMPWKKETNETI